MCIRDRELYSILDSCIQSVLEDKNAAVSYTHLPDFLAVSYSKDVTFDGIKTNGALLMFAPVAYCDGRIVFQNCEMSVTPNSLITSAADGIHLSTNRFGVIIENCNLNNSLDDLINTEAYCGEIVKIIDNYTYETSRDMFCKIGDEIKFFDVSNHAVVGKAFLTKVEQTENGMYRFCLLYTSRCV